MEETLRDLQKVMAAHRRVLAAARARPQGVRPGETIPAAAPGRAPALAPEDARQPLVARLVADIERVSGIAVTGVVERKLARVLASARLDALAAWIAQLHRRAGDDPEWLSVIESLTVHETFFHRDGAQLALLGRLLRRRIDERAASGHCCLRLWSAGCATGEEAYTLAVMALLALRDAGLADATPDGGIVPRPPWQVDVVGSDISRLVLAQARSAVYSAGALGAFRDLPAELRRFFPVLESGGGVPAGERRGVHRAVRRLVRFHRGNLAAEAPPAAGFDVILCRNVLVYLTAAARTATHDRLRGALRPGGYLLLGPTDAPAEPAAYEPLWGDGAVAYRLKPRR